MGHSTVVFASVNFYGHTAILGRRVKNRGAKTRFSKECYENHSLITDKYCSFLISHYGY